MASETSELSDAMTTRIGPHERLTQAKMEEFFGNDDFFVHATPGLFATVPLALASG